MRWILTMQRLQRKEAMDYLLAIIILMDHFPKEYERKLTWSKKKSLLVFMFWFWEQNYSQNKKKWWLFIDICWNSFPKEGKKKNSQGQVEKKLTFAVSESEFTKSKIDSFVSNFLDLKPSKFWFWNSKSWFLFDLVSYLEKKFLCYSFF